jgi:hypothetical protein
VVRNVVWQRGAGQGYGQGGKRQEYGGAGQGYGQGGKRAGQLSQLNQFNPQLSQFQPPQRGEEVNWIFHTSW